MMRELTERLDTRFTCMTCKQDRDLEHGARRSISPEVDIFQCYVCIQAMTLAETKEYVRQKLDAALPSWMGDIVDDLAKGFKSFLSRQL